MFKLENYITPILLSYVDKYIKNFRTKDSQVSLWGGDVSFHNLDLKLEVLEQELQLPFSFVSGHIHELLIHVPWTKLASEPITITINTIECILKLRSSDNASSDLNTSKERLRRSNSKKQDIEAPPGYVQLLINKIVGNIKINCNNLILKYVEEDIVVSMNVKLLTFESGNEKWEPSYIDITSAQGTLRKLISISDLTICLDRRNAAGKIDIYQEPVLYRSSLVIHMLRQYHSASAKRASTTRIDIHCGSMEFSMTEQQVPMLMRISLLLLALQQRQVRPESEINIETPDMQGDMSDLLETSESWAGWAWSWVPSLLPTSWDEEWNQDQQTILSDHTVHIGFYVDVASLTFKVSESNNERGTYYTQRKVKYLPLLILRLQGIFVESITHGTKWFHCQSGISQIVLLPIGQCSCSHQEIADDTILTEYFKAGLISMAHKSDSLFDAEAPENKGQNKTYNTSWDFHMLTVTESSLLERTPAFASDFLYQVEIPDDISSDRLSELGSDLEYSNLYEQSLLRIVLGPLRLHLCSGFFHRTSSLKVAASAYDYSPYSVSKPDLLLSELSPPCAEDFDALSDNIPLRCIQITIIAPAIEFQIMDHPYFEPTKRNLYSKRKKVSVSLPSPGVSNYRPLELPKLTLECQCIDAKFEYPMYVKRLVYTVCKLPDPPKSMFAACYITRNVKVIGLSSKLITSVKKQITIITPSSASFIYKSILKPQYWTDPDIPHNEWIFESENLTITATKANLMLIAFIIDHLIKLDGQDIMKHLKRTTILNDASRSFGMAYLELCLEELRCKKVTTNVTTTIDLSFGIIKAFIYEPIIEASDFMRDTGSLLSGSSYSGMSKRLNSSIYSTRNSQQVLFISGPEYQSELPPKMTEVPLLTATIQYPLNPNNQVHPPILIFNIQEAKICIDPLLCRWLLYTPRQVLKTTETFDPLQRKAPSISEASGSILETPRRAGTPLESIHSSSDRDHVFGSVPTQKLSKENDATEQHAAIYNFLRDWFDVWKSMLLNGEIGQCTIYLPVGSLSAVGSQGIQEAVEEALKKTDPPEIFVITLPLVTIYSSAPRQGLFNYLSQLPIKLPNSMWTRNKSGFPWLISISELSCYTLQNNRKLYFLKPLLLNVTIAISTKTGNSDIRLTKSDKTNNITHDNITVKQMKRSDAINLDASSSQYYTNLKTDIGRLGVCIHIDMASIDISISEVQICLIASIVYGLTEVVNTLLPAKTKDNSPKSPEAVQSVLGWGSTISPTLLRESTASSVSEKTASTSKVTKNVENESAKLTPWVQWTIAHFKIQVLSHDTKDFSIENVSYLYHPNVKLVMDAEGIVTSLDFQSVYLKIKSKIASANIRHFKRKTGTTIWKPGQFLGLIMRTKEDVATSERQEDIGFATITITRASCQHTHALWGAVQKNKLKETKINSESTVQIQNSLRYITEIDLTTQPIDFILSLSTLRSFYMVLEPLVEMSALASEKNKDSNWLLEINNQNLPLIYLECQGIRIIIPSLELDGTGAEHDVCIFQVDTINLSPSAINPICRVPCRPDIYQSAAQSRILNIPGSEVENRQYQLDITGLTVNTGIWEDLDLNLQGSSFSSLRTMSENPALEWNNLEKGRLSITPHLNFWPIISKFDITVVVAPAMIYKMSTLVCGHSIEVNCVSDVEVNLSLSQIQLVSALLIEFLYIFEPFLLEEIVIKRPKITFPYPKFDPSTLDMEEDEIEVLDFALDSGIETSEFQRLFSIRTKESVGEPTQMNIVKRQPKYFEKENQFEVFPRPPNPLPPAHHNIPVDVLITGGNIILILYQLDKLYGREQIKKDKRTKPVLILKDYDRGYEGSEEGSLDEKHPNSSLELKQFSPLLFVSLSQPNAFLSRFYLGRKIQLSCFDVHVKISGPEYVPLNAMPTEKDYPINLLETKSGMPDPDTGVHPAFFTLKWSRGLGKPATVDIEIARPTRILCSVTRWNHLIVIKDKILKSCKALFENLNDADFRWNVKNESNIHENVSSSTPKPTETYIKFKDIKKKIYKISSLNVKLAQIVLVAKTDHVPEVDLSISKLTHNLTISNRPEKLINIITLESLTVGILKDGITRLLLNPCTLTIETSLFWESWQSIDSDPQIQISIESDCIMIDISPQQIKDVEEIVKELTDFFINLSYENSLIETESSTETANVPTTDKEQYYKDDLRAGAFQFVDANNHNIAEILPYQVMFWNTTVSAMAWRYPQPRAITKICVFPVPFKTVASDSNYQILCHLEYWSKCHGCFRPYLQFYLSESEINYLDLPENNMQYISSIWRVLLSTQNKDLQSYDFDCLKFMISPRALAACMRIDSYFNKTLVPDLTLALEISTINISLYSNFNKSVSTVMDSALKDYTCDLLFPENVCFLSFTLDGTKAYLATWNFYAAAFDITSTMKCSVLDYAFLTQQTLLEPFALKVEMNIGKNVGISFISEPINIKFGASIAHTLAVSSQIWEQSWTSRHRSDEYQNLIVMTLYVICNDSNINLRFGQTLTDENILLIPRYCNLYCWRSQKSIQKLRVASEENGWIWSRSFYIDYEGTQTCQINSDNNLGLIITVKQLSGTQKQIIFSGRLTICNMLLEHFELKVVMFVNDDKDKEFRKSPSHIIPGKSTPPSLLINTEQKYHLRVRFFGLESAWSGDIPLKENSKSTKPWLVKVPLQERGKFMSIWCQIITESLSNGSQILAVLWPLFMIRSHLPVSAKVQIETPILNVQLESTVCGKGEYQQLYCPGTIDHPHQLSFEMDDETRTSNKYYPLSYSLVDEKEFFKRPKNQSISHFLKSLSVFDKTEWPYFGDDYNGIEWISEDQRITHVEAKYQNACPYSSALLVEILPWCLLINTLGCPIAIIVNQKELCRICHHGIVTLPILEETFHIGVEINGTWNISLPLQITKSEWSQTFYMPKITGTIGLENTIRMPVICHKHLCMISITSNLKNEIRLLKISSSHVLANYMPMQFHVLCLAISEAEECVTIFKDVEKYSFIAAPCLEKCDAGISIIQWYILGKEMDINSNFVLYISLSLNTKYGWSCPVRVDKGLTRRSIAVQSENQSIPIILTAQEYKGQTYLSISNDLHPQLFIENTSGKKLYFGQASIENDNERINDCSHIKWICSIDNLKKCYYSMPNYSAQFPELSQDVFPQKLVIASNSYDDGMSYQWSNPILVTSYNEQYVRIPCFNDVKITLTNSIHTTFLSIDSASQVEISARDIRVRLFMHETETNLRKEIDDKQNEREDEEFLNTISTNNGTHSTIVSIPDDIPGTSTQISTKYNLPNQNSSSFQSVSERAPYGFRILPTLQEKSHLTVTNSNSFKKSFLDMKHTDACEIPLASSLLTSTVPMGRNCTIFKIVSFIKGISLTLLANTNSISNDNAEIINVNCDDIVITATQTETMEVFFSVSEVQVDNQMWGTGNFDFPVMLIGQQAKPRQSLSSLNTSIIHWITLAQKNPLIRVLMSVETWKDPGLNKKVTKIKDIKMQLQPLSIFIEDACVMKLQDYLTIFTPTKLVLWSNSRKRTSFILNSTLVGIPDRIVWERSMIAYPLTLQTLSIEPVSILLSIHWSLKIYIALDQSPLEFTEFERKRLLTTSYRLGHALTMHYLSGAIFGAGWVVGSLELLGSPSGLARAMGTGLRDFIHLPYQGLIQGPWAFLRGISHGSASLMKHVTAGTLQSVTKLASSVAINLNRLTLDEEHLRRTEEQRRQRPQGIAQGFLQGLTSLGISLLGAVGGIAHHPIQSVMIEGASPRGLIAGVGLGLVGVFTKPLSGAADLVALTGQGLLEGAGWNPLPEPRTRPSIHDTFSNSNSIAKYVWKYMKSITQSNFLFVTDAIWLSNDGQYERVALLLTTEALIIINTDEDTSQRIITLPELSGVDNTLDPTLLNLKLAPVPIPPINKDECDIDMDPACRARVADYVRNTVGLLQFPDGMSPDPSGMSVPPPVTPNSEIIQIGEPSTLCFYVTPQSRNYFVTILSLAKQQRQNYSFPVL